MPVLLQDADRGIAEADFTSRSTAIAFPVAFAYLVVPASRDAGVDMQPALADVPIEQLSSCCQQTIGHTGKETPCDLHSVAFIRDPKTGNGNSNISQHRPGRTKVVFESN